jgi:hypothetical protein
MNLSSPEEIVPEFPSIGYQFLKSIGVELSDKAGEVAVFEVEGQQISSKLWWPPHYERRSITVLPRNYVVCFWIVNEMIGFGQEWRWH